MSSTQSNAAAIRSFRIIEIISEARQPLSLTQIVEKIELPKQTVHRLLKQLESAWIITRNTPGREYECSSRLRRAAVNMLMTAGPAAARRAILQQLVDTVGETCNLAISSGDDIVYLDRVEANWPLRKTLSPGSRVPYHCTSCGKLFLSFLPKQQREKLLKKLPLRGNTTQTITNLDVLRQELVEIRKKRVSFNNQEFMPGMIAIAVPVMLDKTRACAAVAIQSPIERTSVASLLTFLPQLRHAASEIAATFQEGRSTL
ncbi:IclR family transcriptional regulator [Paralcaligenes ureilyticus]|uniref:IclR family transcriptional regulator n=1 Tax=Paralcaligenes ureilyticus TaxID=627131 RepID=A0A4R3M246_9BURK|nr:IclR family transcriptional regulator [Paralcaligenes ureilyticus]TCT05267.1 IclR family transcriptional regulator [Paralcaligenes ureilyticus]